MMSRYTLLPGRQRSKSKAFPVKRRFSVPRDIALQRRIIYTGVGTSFYSGYTLRSDFLSTVKAAHLIFNMDNEIKQTNESHGYLDQFDKAVGVLIPQADKPDSPKTSIDEVKGDDRDVHDNEKKLTSDETTDVLEFDNTNNQNAASALEEDGPFCETIYDALKELEQEPGPCDNMKTPPVLQGHDFEPNTNESNNTNAGLCESLICDSESPLESSTVQLLDKSFTETPTLKRRRRNSTSRPKQKNTSAAPSRRKSRLTPVRQRKKATNNSSTGRSRSRGRRSSSAVSSGGKRRN